MKRFLLIVISIVLLGSLFIPTTHAISTAEFYSANDVLYYDPNASDCSSSAAGGGASGIVGSGGFSFDQVKAFAAEPIGTTWNISDSTAESWFLSKTGGVKNNVIIPYDLNSSNIGAITAAVKSAGVSPAFFYAYAVNEGGNKTHTGAFINHWEHGPVATPDRAVADAQKDANYLASESQNMSNDPATLGGEPANMPTAEAAALLATLPAGSIGRIYIRATSAVTAEIEYLSGHPENQDPQYGKPLEAVMVDIKDMGGDPMIGGATITSGTSGSGCTTSSGVAGAGMQKAINWAILIAGNDGYWYSMDTSGPRARTGGWATYQSNPGCSGANGTCGHFDCSSFVSSALTYAGYYTTNPFFNTGNEAASLKGIGFTDVSSALGNGGSGLQPGDILINPGHHTALYIGNNQMVEAQNGNTGIVVDTYRPEFTSVWRAPN